MTNTIPLDIDTDEVEDKFVDNTLQIDNLDTGVRGGLAGQTMEDLENKPGAGVPVGDRYREPPKMTPDQKVMGRGSRGKVGRPVFIPNDEQRQFVINCLAIDGDDLINIAYNIGIHYDTLVKHFPMEIELGNAKTRGEIRGILLRNARRSEFIPAFQRSLEFCAKVKGMVVDKMELDHTSSDGSMSPSPAVLLMPPSPHRNDYQEAPQPSSASKKDKPVKKPVTKPATKKSAKKPTKKSTKKE